MQPHVRIANGSRVNDVVVVTTSQSQGEATRERRRKISAESLEVVGRKSVRSRTARHSGPLEVDRGDRLSVDVDLKPVPRRSQTQCVVEPRRGYVDRILSDPAIKLIGTIAGFPPHQIITDAAVDLIDPRLPRKPVFS